MNVKCKLLFHYEIDPWWPKVSPWILQAVGVGGNETDLEYIQAQSKAGNCQIWVVFNDTDIEAVLVTESAFYGGRKTLILRWLSGKREEDWTEILQRIEDWAYHNKYERTEVWGRKGWERAMRPQGYSHEFTVLGKSLNRRMH